MPELGGGLQDALTWLQSWYRERCDGVWEHAHGVRIDTLDNPGWRVTVDVGASVTDRTFRHERGEDDWVEVRVAGGQFLGAGGPENLVELLDLLRSWCTEDEDRGADVRTRPA